MNVSEIKEILNNIEDRYKALSKGDMKLYIDKSLKMSIIQKYLWILLKNNIHCVILKIYIQK